MKTKKDLIGSIVEIGIVLSIILSTMYITGCRTANPAITDLLVNISTFAGDQDVANWDGKTLEEQREVLVKAKEIAPVALIDRIDKEIERIDEKIRIRDLPPTPTPEPEPEPESVPDGLYSVKGSQRLLVKPVADEGKDLVILLPAAWNNSFKDVWIETESGRYNDTGRRNINANLENPNDPPYNSNDNRRHIWFKAPGSAIGKGVLVVVLDDGTRRLNRDFSVRTEPVEK